jgi:phosphoribosyl 1,2-cyclic phosphodiesterase
MVFKSFASGSSGNLYTVESSTTRLLIECGIAFNKMKKALDYRLQDLDGCLITHQHKDHCKAHKDLAKHGIEMFMTKETAGAIGADTNWTTIVYPKEIFYVKDFMIVPFETKHDVPGSVGFMIRDRFTKELFVYLTDSYYSKYKFKDMNILAIECNYNDEAMKESRINEYMENRIKRSHFSLKNLISFLKANDLSKIRHIYLLHMSDHNADEEYIKEQIQKATGKEITIC